MARASYAAPGDVRAAADATKVGMGERVQIHLTAKSSGNIPTEPQLSSNSLIFEASAPNAMPSQSISIVNGQMTASTVLSVDWTLLAKQLGTATFTLRVKINGTLVKSNPVTITVVPAGKAPPRQPTRPTDPFGGMFGGQNPFAGQPFDPFSMLNGQALPNDLQTMPLQPAVPLDPKLALNAPRGAVAFLHAISDKVNAVVGEQVTYSVYLYVDPDQREPDFNDVHESSASDFLKQNLIDDSKDSQPVQYASVGGKIWGAKLIRKWALFPLKTGLLEIGSMRLAVVGGRGGNAARTSDTVVVKVDEPPITGRPPGYVSGSVGLFTAVANVTPRDVERGGGISVDLSISGTGNIPTNVTPPPQEGVDWLVPEVRDAVSGQSGVFGGSRNFSFIVHMNKAGAIDLGEIAIPYFDPAAKTYGVARAPLGVVNVKGNGKPDVADAHDEQPLQGLPALKDTLAREAPHKHLADRPGFWALLVLCPFSFVIVAGGRSASRRLRDGLAFRRASPESLLSKRIADAKNAGKLSDARVLDAAIAKMIEQATIVRAGVNVRALTIDEAEDHLAVRGVKRETAVEIADLLRACDEARFLPDEGNIEISRERLASALATIDDLRKVS
ncbi:MAG: BatD family protein [Polyangiaceae bacterium]